MKKLFVTERSRGIISISVILVTAFIAMAVVAFLPAINIAIMGENWTVNGAIVYLNRSGYTVTDPVGTVYVDDLLPNADSTWDIGASGSEFAEGYFDNLILSGSGPIALEGDGKVWIEFRPELDFDIVKKNAVPVSYERGIFTGFELPIYAADDQELFFEICVPDRWDGISTTHVHLDVFPIDAQDDGDAFRLQIVYEHYSVGINIVPNTSTNIEVETSTGTSAAFQSFQVHFDVPAGDMLGDDILAFRLRRIAVVAGVEIDNNVVFNHAGVIFLCDKLGNVTAE